MFYRFYYWYSYNSTIDLNFFRNFVGAGLLIGYRFGHLSRPIGYGGSGYGYNYIHKDR